MLNKYIYTLVFFVLLITSGCTSLQPEKIPPEKAPASSTKILINKNLNFLLLPAFAIKKPLSLTQTVQIKYADKQYDFIAQIEIADHSFKMVGLTNMGIKLFSIISTENYYDFKKSPLLGDEINLTYLLADLQLTYWPLNQLNKQLQLNNALIETRSQQRLILHRDKPIIDIQFSNTDHWNTNITFTHLQRNYSVTINTLEMADL